MFRKLIFTVICFFGVILSGCTESEIKEEDLTNFNKMEWMLGIWEGKQQDADIYESWRKKNFRIMEGISYTTLEKRRVYSQDMKIIQSGNNISLIVKPARETEEMTFALKEVSDSAVVFENTGTGFPSHIKYTLDGKTMTVISSGDNEESETSGLTYRKTTDY